VVCSNGVVGTCAVCSKRCVVVCINLIEACHERISVGLECVGEVWEGRLHFTENKSNLCLVCNRVKPAVWVVCECFFIAVVIVTIFIAVIIVIIVIIMSAMVVAFMSTHAEDV